MLACGHVSKPFPANEDRDEAARYECDKCFMEAARDMERIEPCTPEQTREAIRESYRKAGMEDPFIEAVK